MSSASSRPPSRTALGIGTPRLSWSLTAMVLGPRNWWHCAGTTSTSPLDACMYAGPRARMPACIRYQRGKAARCASSCGKPQRPHTSSSRSAARRCPQPDISTWLPGRAWLRNSRFSCIPTCCGMPAGSSSPTTATTLAPSKPISGSLHTTTTFRAQVRRREHRAWRTAASISQNRNLLANLTQPHDRLEQAFLDHGIVSVKSFDHLIVGSPPHPFRFWRQFPFVGVEATNRAKSRFDLSRAPMTPGDAIHRLRGVSDSRAPSFSTREGMSARRHPQHGRETMQMRAREEPLSTAEMTPAGHQVYALVQLSKSDAKPSCSFATHVRSDVTRSNLLAGVVRPSDADRPGNCARLNEP